MGMCYTINIDIRYKAEDNNKLVLTMAKAANMDFVGDIYDTTIDCIIGNVCSGMEVKKTESNGVVTIAGQCTVDGSFSYDSYLTNWFEEIAPMLESGSEIEIFPDNGYESRFILGSNLYRVNMEYANFHRIFFTYDGSMYAYDVADATIDNPDDLENDIEQQRSIIEESLDIEWHRIGVVADKVEEVKLMAVAEIDDITKAFDYHPELVGKIKEDAA